MRRREFLTLVGGAVVMCPLAARAQQPGKLPTIGYLGGAASSPESVWLAAFVQRLGELGWLEGRTVSIQRRWAASRPERIAEVAAEYVRQKVDVIVTYGGAVATIRQATTSIPIVFAVAIDPVGVGFVASLSHPGGNVTGLSLQTTDTTSKRLEFLREVVPDLRRLAIIFDASYPASVREMDNVSTTARQLGLEVAPHWGSTSGGHCTGFRRFQRPSGRAVPRGKSICLSATCLTSLLLPSTCGYR